MKTLKKAGLSLALAGGVLGAAAPMASAGTSTYIDIHNSATYTSRASCQTNHDGAVAHIKRVWTYRSITYNGVCDYNKATNRWTYGHITYVTNGGMAMVGDHILWHN